MVKGKVLFENGEYDIEINIESGFMGENEIVIHFPKDADITNWKNSIAVVKDL